MSCNPESFKAPFLTKYKCWEAADDFRRKYWKGKSVPVDVMAIADFELELEIRPVPQLKEQADTDALLLGNWETILLDQKEYMDARFENRIRASVAHELVT